MKIRLHSSLWGSLEAGLMLLVLGTGAWWGVAEWMAWRREQEWRALDRQGGAAGSEDLAALAAARADADQVRRRQEELAARWEATLGAEDDVGAMDVAGLDRAEVFFELALRMEEFRRQLREAGVAMKEAEHFGFETYRSAGPSIAALAVVVRQQAHVARLIDAVAAGRARALEGIGREVAGAESSEERNLADFFAPDPRLRLRLSPGCDQGLFRVTFSGETATLRGFLARLAETSPHALVRWIDVVPTIGAAPDGEVPLRFVVTVAFIEWPRADGRGREAGS